MRTVSAYGFDVTLLQDFFKMMRDKYIELATQSYRTEFLKIMEKETFQPLFVTKEEEYQLMIVENDLHQIWPHQLRLPMEFPFCAFLPNCVSVVKHFIQTYYEFSKDLFSDTDEFVKKGTERLLKIMCSTIITQVIESTTSNVSSLVYLSLSLPYMKSCCNIFEGYIASFKYLGAEPSPLNRSMFDALRESTEKRMFTIIDQKIDQLFDNVNINWTPQVPSREPREWVGELFLYLQTTLAVFDPLRKELRDEITVQAFDRTATCLKNMVYNANAKRINIAAVQSLDNDLRYAESYIRKWNIPSLQSCLQELRQLINLLLADNILEFLDERIRRAKYPDLTDTSKLVCVLQRFETESTLGRFSGALGGRASKRQTIETLIRSLSTAPGSPSAFGRKLRSNG